MKFDPDKKTYEVIKSLLNENITINLNINAFSIEKLNAIFDELIDSLSFDVESFNPDFLKKRSVNFDNLTRSFEFAEKQGVFISVNLLTLPGFTDSTNEVEKTIDFLNTFKIEYLKLRDLKTVPHKFFKENKIESTEILGLKNMLKYIKKRCKRVKMGYFSRVKRDFHLPTAFKIK